MKQIINITKILMLLFCQELAAQTANDNYVKTVTKTGYGQTTSVTYYDAFGRPFQTVSDGSDTKGTCIVSQDEYDSRGDIIKSWMPVKCSSLARQATETITSAMQTTYGESGAFSIMTYDATGQKTSQIGPGKAWHDGNKKVTVKTVPAGTVTRYEAPIENTSLVRKGTYAAGTLTCVTTTDEDGRSVSEYKDRFDRTIMTRRGTSSDTYYVYNIRGQLRFVLTPMYQQKAKKALYAYEYRYDDYGRVVKIIRPGCETERRWYDKANRVVFMQDGVLSADNKARFCLYDRLGRPCITGICSTFKHSDNATRNNVSFNASQRGLCGTGYTPRDGQTLDMPELETATYYDDYTFLTRAAALIGVDREKLEVPTDKDCTGLVTGTIEVSSDGRNVVFVLGYDRLGRETESLIAVENGIWERTTIVYSFTDKPTKQTRKWTSSNGEVMSIATEEFTYSTKNDLLISKVDKVTVGGKTATAMTLYEYDALGRIVKTTRSGLGETTFSYNTRGWTTNISNANFSETLGYESGVGTPMYSGLISSTAWSTNGSTRQGYKLSYDALGRLTKASYGESSILMTNADRWTENFAAYDLNGNITKLQRNGLLDDGAYGRVDDLAMTYDGDKLKSVADKADAVLRNGADDFIDGANSDTEYGYDANGRMIWDANKGIAYIEYDYYAHPVLIVHTDGSTLNSEWTPSGRRLYSDWRTAIDGLSVPIGGRREISGDEVLVETYTTYAGDLRIFNNGKIRLYLGDDYADISGESISMRHMVRDHLGSVRVVTDDAGKVLQQLAYYPSGLTIPTQTAIATTDPQPQKYSGKELDQMHGLWWYDYGARQYDPQLCRWTSQDALAEKYINVSPYSYCAGNPITHVEVDGNGWYNMPTIDANGKSIESIEYDEDSFTEEDFEENAKKKGINGKWLGMRYQKGNDYYSLFGTKENLKTVQGAITKKIDEAIIKQIKYDNRVAEQYNNPSIYDEEIKQPRTDFYINVKSSKTMFNIKYAGSDFGLYNIATGNRNNNWAVMLTPIEGVYKPYGGHFNMSDTAYCVIWGNGNRLEENVFDNVLFRFNKDSKLYSRYIYKLNLIRRAVK